MRRTCKQCGREFELTDSQIEWYESKGLDLPKRCEDCRAENREKRSVAREESRADSSGETARQRTGEPVEGARADLEPQSGAMGGLSASPAASGSATPVRGGAAEGGAGGKRIPRKAIGSAIALVIAAVIGLGGTAGGAGTVTDAGGQAGGAAAQTQQHQAGYVTYKFRTKGLLNSHYDKHGKAMGYADAQAYVAGANEVVNDPEALHKVQREDGDDVYYLQATDELVIVSSDGYIRTYFNPGGIEYYYRQ